MKDKVSVHIACYSKSNEKWLQETIKSIRNQGLEPDATRDERNTTIKWDEAIANCKTPYLHLAQHEEIYLPGFYEATVGWLDAHPDASAVFTMDYIINEHGNRIGQTSLPFPPKDSYTYTEIFNLMVEHGNFLRCPSVVLRVDKVRDLVHPLDECQSANDTAYWYECLLKGPIGIIPKPLYRYRQTPWSDTQANVIGTPRQLDHLRAMRYALRKHPDKTSIKWNVLVNLSRELSHLDMIERNEELVRKTETAKKVKFVVVHEPPDNAGTGVLAAQRVREGNREDDAVWYYVYPVPGDTVSVGVENGVPVIKCPPQGFWEVVGRFNPSEIEYHHLLGWAYDILSKREGVQQRLYLHDSFLWCPIAHFVNKNQEVCEGPGPSRCNTCAGFSPADYESRNSVLAQLLPMLDGIYANSTYTQENAVKWLPGPRSHDVQLHEFEPPELPIYAKRVRIGFFGYFNPVKGIHILSQAWQKVTGAQLLLFCQVPDDLRDGRWKIHGFDNVLVMDSYRRADLPLLTNLCDLVVVPSLNESYGLVGREVEQIGCRVIRTNTGGQVGTVPPGDAEALAEAIQEAVDGMEDDYYETPSGELIPKSHST